MTKIATSHIATIGVILVILILLGSLLAHPGGMLTDLSGRVFAPVSGALHRATSAIGTFVGRRDLVSENVRLTAQVQAAQGQAAQIDALTQENAFLKATIGLKSLLARPPIEGGVFSYSIDGGVRQLVVNRGIQDGVVAGQAVITAQGALVGIVQDVAAHHATVRSLGDPLIEVTGRIVGSEVTGLIRVDATQGLMLDLVQKSENVTEGQVVMTSGNDHFPPGLIIGTVRSVDGQSATLFKIVRVDPMAGDHFNGQVLILQP